MRAYGNIQIDTDSTNIWADSLYYFSNNDVSLLRGRVVIRQDSATLFGSQVDYNFETKEAVFPQGIRLEDKKGVLVARQGEYYEEQDSAVFRFDVQVQDTSQYVEGDSLFNGYARLSCPQPVSHLVVEPSDPAIAVLC